MCTKPVKINRNNRLAGLYRSPGALYVTKPGEDYFRKQLQLDGVHGFLRQSATVPCGKCVECLKKRQNDLAVRAAREASKRGSMQFLTLTYDNAHLPLQITYEEVDKDTGEIYRPYPSSPLIRCEDADKEASPEFVNVCRAELERIALSPYARVYYHTIFETDESIFRYCITPSLYRRDVRLWLKRCRVRYLREKGEPLPDFSYIIVGEYGPRTCRPHYHLAFFGLQKEHVQYLRDQWDFGSITDLRSVNAVNPDGTNGFEIAAKYIGKYMSKGKFECDSVKECISEKPRLMLSQGVGCDLPDSLVSYYRCYDLFGRYDFSSMVNPKTGVRFTTPELLSLATEVRKRSSITIGEHKYALPRNILIKLWYEYNPVTCSYHASDLRLALSALVCRDPVADFTRQLHKNRPGISISEARSAIREFIAFSENSIFSKEKAGEETLQAFYNSSIF